MREMKGYVIIELDIFDKEKIKEYKSIAPGIIKKYKGEIVVRGGEILSLEGNWEPKRVVIIQFPSYKQAKQWWHSPEYAEAKKLKEKAAKSNLVIFEGV